MSFKLKKNYWDESWEDDNGGFHNEGVYQIVLLDSYNQEVSDFWYDPRDWEEEPKEAVEWLKKYNLVLDQDWLKMGELKLVQ